MLGIFRICMSPNNIGCGRGFLVARLTDRIISFRVELVRFNAKLNSTTLLDCSMHRMYTLLLRVRSSHFKKRGGTEIISSAGVFSHRFVHENHPSPFYVRRKQSVSIYWTALHLKLLWFNILIKFLAFLLINLDLPFVCFVL